MNKIGYMRCSTKKQDTALQEAALKEAGCTEIYKDTISGSSTSRPGLDLCLASLKRGETLVVWKLDRLGRSLQHLIGILNNLKLSGVGFISLTEHYDTTTPTGQLMFNITGSFAEFERSIIKERVLAGLEAAKARGKILGRRQEILAEDVEIIKEMDGHAYSQTFIAKTLGISQPSVSRILKNSKA